jgi:hypothetical protein
VVLALVVTTTGCATPSHLIFHTSTTLGVDVATSADNSTIHARVGYDRQTATIIPKTRVKNGQGQEEPEAMAVIGRSRIKIRWFRPSEICERFATGKAALNMASQSAAGALRGDGSTPNGCEDW